MNVKRYLMGLYGVGSGLGPVQYSECSNGLSTDLVSGSKWGDSSTDSVLGLGVPSCPVGSCVLGFSSALSKPDSPEVCVSGSAGCSGDGFWSESGFGAEKQKCLLPNVLVSVLVVDC